ncbi:MAG TPA: NAD(P)-dependent alcohol dehydrogenase [Burkholderiales bacterium]|nr:NAD(P)-dependent alcohol dehydrogenase [Burkholderiales bacterium]
MKSWQVIGPGREGLRLVETEKPFPHTGEVLVKVGAVSLNYRDRLMIEKNAYATYGLPFTPCSDLAGRVEALGSGVNRFSVGDCVINNFTAGWLAGPPPRAAGVIPSFGGPIQGVLSEYVAVPAEWLTKAPVGLSTVEASTLPCAGLTAWTSLIELGGLKPGQIVLVQGTGGVSLFALQFACAADAEVIVTTTTDEKMERVKALGARHVINRVASTDWAARVMQLTGGRGADHIIEVAGGTNLGASVTALAPGGQIYLIGVIESFDGTFPSVPAMHAFASIRAVFVGNRDGLGNMVRAIDVNGLKPIIDSEVDFEEFPSALDRLGRGPFGKVVVRV